jgi:hypothetical protein
MGCEWTTCKNHMFRMMDTILETLHSNFFVNYKKLTIELIEKYI